MRLLLINPNTSHSMTDRMMRTALACAQPGTQIRAVTASEGVPYIATRAEAQIGGRTLLDLLAENRAGRDAAIVAAFGDPGLFAARQLFDIPVIGLAEAAMLSACMLGGRFGIVTFSPVLRHWFEDCVAMHGLTARCSGIRTPDATPGGDVAMVQEEREDQLVELCLKAVEADGADVIIPAGAPLTGLAEKIRERVPVPVVDQVVAAVKQAEAIVALKVRPASAGAFRRPDPKPTLGLAASLAAWLAHEEAMPSVTAIRPHSAGGEG
ncbi:aspartate/glutamate racemase family protein [Rhizobium sp. SL86]|uniref:aspartate/glutamate racemase family protein n=1 Tax=Rhizobium sp. SL86 TaxID=2995148 RepID=UPI002272AC62|nr:aspartate/glutamate racemase family protein [Rhizobium sp. SL86]MCY1667782.1 aspartate/glutamate racemase family protein [Rhizobium sp. SL86]